MTPYNDEKQDDGSTYRYFAEDVNEWDLVWHRDKRDRKVKVLSGEDWQIQFDNEMPYNINEGDEITIKAMAYHRLIRGSSPLEIVINEF